MKADLIQGDFSSGELSPRLHGRVQSDVYKSGVAYAENFLPTMQGSMASRSGGRLVTDGITGALSLGKRENLIPVQGGPSGDFVMELEDYTTYAKLRMFDRWGARPIRLRQDLTGFFEDNANASEVWTDPEKHEIHFRGAGSVSLLLDRDGMRMLRTGGSTNARVGLALYGDGGNVILEEWVGATLTASTSLLVGYNSVQLASNTVTIVLRGDGGVNDVGGLVVAGETSPGAGWVTSLVVPGVVVGPGLRWTYFWADIKSRDTNSSASMISSFDPNKPRRDFYLYLVGPGMVLVRIHWNSSTDLWDAADSGLFEWLEWKKTGGGAIGAWITEPPWNIPGGISAIHAYQGRLWFGLQDSAGTIKATAIGFFSFNTSHQLRVQDHYASVVAQPSAPSDPAVLELYCNFGGRFSKDDELHIHIIPARSDPVELDPAHRDEWWHVTADTLSVTGFYVKLDVGHGIPADSTVWITRKMTPAGASDPLDLNIAQPTGPVMWFSELRGLVMGTTLAEFVFSAGSLAVDPVTGSAFDITKHSAFGSDKAVPALPAQDKVLFIPPGRRRIRLVGESIQTSGGLVAQDISVFGEHLLERRIKDFVFLKSPIPRIVAALDDGTGAIGLLREDTKSLAWSRFTLPAPYSLGRLAALDTVFGSELWVATDQGDVLVFPDLESKPYDRYHAGAPVVESALPAMDGRIRMRYQPSLTYAGLPNNWIGKYAWVIVNGVAMFGGPLLVFDAEVSAAITLPEAIPATWTDANGNIQLTEAYVGLAYPEHKFITLAQEGGNPQGTSQAFQSRAVQLYLRLVDSYIPKVGGVRGVPERNAGDATDAQATRISKDVRATQLGFERARRLVIEQDLPLRVEVSAIFGGTQVQSF